MKRPAPWLRLFACALVGSSVALAFSACSWFETSRDEVATKAFEWGGLAQVPSMSVDYAEHQMAGFDDGYQVVVSFSNTELEQLLSESGLTEARTPVGPGEVPELLMQLTYDLQRRSMFEIKDDLRVANKPRFRCAYFACAPTECTASISVFET